MVAQIVGSLLLFSFASLFSGMMFPPGDVPRQFAVVLVWYFAGGLTARLWC